MVQQTVRNFRGTTDYYGDDARFRLSVIATIQRVFEAYGFEPLITPMIETEETLNGKYGDEGEMKRFRLAYPNEGGLRYDHTVPLARFMAMNWNKFPLPYRRYAIGPVLRNETVQAGRKREFTQCDFDTVGSSSPIIDAEIVAMNYNVLRDLGFNGGYAVMINDRRLLNAMVKRMNVTDEQEILAIFRAWDKLEKVTPQQAFDGLVDEFVKMEQKRIGREFEKGEEIVAARVATSRLNTIYAAPTEMLYSLKGLPADSVLSQIVKSFPSFEVSEAVKNLSSIVSYITAMGVPDDFYKVDPLLARGLDYYTGPIFETYVTVKGIGSITGGGRFDQLIEKMGGPTLAASGSSFGLERVIGVMAELGLRPDSSQTTQVFMPVFDLSNLTLMEAVFKTAHNLRLTGVNVEVYTGDTRQMRKQLDVANRKGIPLAVIIGSDELNKGEATLKNMTSGSQESVLLNQVPEKATEILQTL